MLGLEVQDPSATTVGKDLTDALRNQARSGTGKYELIGPDKELVDEKLMNSCDNELPACMSPIGTSIGASRLLYGRIRLVQNNFIVDLVLLNVNDKAKEKTLANQRLATSDATDSVKLGTFARNLYKAMTNESSTGTLIVEVTNKDADRGAVKIDGDEKGFLNSGRLPIQNVLDGKHTLTVDVGGFQPFTKEVTVVANERITVSVTLTPESTTGGGSIEKFGTESQGSHTNYWKPMFVTGAIVTAIGGSVWLYAYREVLDGQSRITQFDGRDPAHPVEVDESYCDSGKKLSEVFPDKPNDDVFNAAASESRAGLVQACKNRRYTKYGIAATAIGGVIMLGTFYSAWLRDSAESPSKRVSGRVKKPSLVVTPVLTPTGGFATLRIDW
ncbi:MAG: PEGA domain-containing protein [Proteobacteria bacterium]|nr:PEGA domain-containing protein [Pseudomonadota bacterium]